MRPFTLPILIALCMAALFASEVSGEPLLEVFGLQGCHDCMDFDEFLHDTLLPALAERGIRPIVRSHDVLESAGYERLMSETVRLGWDYRGVPLLKAGDRFFYGDELAGAGLAEELAGILEGTGVSPLLDAPGNLGTDPRVSETILLPDLNLWIVLGAGLVDGINPCALATLLFMVSALALGGRSRAAVASIGASFILGVFLTYFMIGIGLLKLGTLAASLPLLRTSIRVLTALGLGVLGGLGLRDWHAVRTGRTRDIALKLPDSTIRRMHALIRKGTALWVTGFGAAGLGILVSIGEFVCTGQVYLPTLVYISQRRESGAILLLAAYNAVFVLPLVVVFILLMLGLSHAKLMEIFKRNLAASKLALAVFFLAFGVLIAVGI